MRQIEELRLYQYLFEIKLDEQYEKIMQDLAVEKKQGSNKKASKTLKEKQGYRFL